MVVSVRTNPSHAPPTPPGARPHLSTSGDYHHHGGHLPRAPLPTQCGITEVASTRAKCRHKPNISRCMPGAGLSRLVRGKVLLYMPAFQPYRGKPAVRNDREGRGNVGIIRSPIRASILPDSHSRTYGQVRVGFARGRITVQRPSTRCVPVKTDDQLDLQTLHRGRSP